MNKLQSKSIEVTLNQGVTISRHILYRDMARFSIVGTYLDTELEPAFHHSSRTLQSFGQYQKKKTPEITSNSDYTKMISEILASGK